MKYIGLPGVSFMAGITREGAWAGRSDASCVLGEGANELAEASIIATTKVRIMLMATAQFSGHCGQTWMFRLFA